jgi:hypothetical protein
MIVVMPTLMMLMMMMVMIVVVVVVMIVVMIVMMLMMMVMIMVMIAMMLMFVVLIMMMMMPLVVMAMMTVMAMMAVVTLAMVAVAMMAMTVTVRDRELVESGVRERDGRYGEKALEKISTILRILHVLAPSRLFALILSCFALGIVEGSRELPHGRARLFAESVRQGWNSVSIGGRRARRQGSSDNEDWSRRRNPSRPIKRSAQRATPMSALPGLNSGTPPCASQMPPTLTLKWRNCSDVGAGAAMILTGKERCGALRSRV